MKRIYTSNGILKLTINGLTDTQLRATPLAISGSFEVDTSLIATEATLAALNTKIPVSLTVVDGRLQVELPAGGGGLTDAELRATAVPVSLAGSATSANQATEIAALASILAKIIAAPATEAKQDAGNASLSTISGKDFATQTTLAALLAKVIAAPATEAKQDNEITQLTNLNAKDFATQATLAAVLAKIIAAPATEAKQDAGNASLTTIAGKDFATQTTLAALLAKVIAAPSTEAKQDALNTLITTLNSIVATEATLSALNTKTPNLGQAAMAASQPVVIASNQSAVPVSMSAASVLFKGRASTFNTPGRAGTAGQKILSLHNASGSPVTITINKVLIDSSMTVVKAVTVAPPIVRLWKVTVLPTNGTALSKNKIGGTSTSNAAVTVLGDASADNTGSVSALTATLPAGTILSQEYAPRIITGAGYEMADRMEFLGDTTITLAALEGVVVFLDYVLATQNPTTDRWIASIEWTEV